MADDRDIIEAVRHMAGTHDGETIYIIDAEVQSVDKDNRICNCIGVGGKTGNEFPNVRLMSAIGDGLLIIPAIYSTITIVLTTFTEPVIIGYSDIDSIILLGGDLGGLVVTPKLIKKLNNIEKLLNDFILKFNTHVHPVPAVGSPTGTTATTETGTINPTIITDIENPNIRQG